MDGLIGLVETREFQHRSEELLNEVQKDTLFAHLSQHPEAGVIVPETGGVRKLRWPARGKGKRGARG